MININKNLFLSQNDNITAIASGATGMGKTWLAISLAQALNMLRQKVLLFDADNGLQNIMFQLALQNSNIDEVINDKKSINQIVESFNKKRLDVICGISGSNILVDIPVGRLQTLREDLLIEASRYDNVLIDLPNEEKIFQHFLPQNADLILICTGDPANLVATYKFLQETVQNYKYNRLQIIVNYANSYEDGLQTYNILHRACGQYIKSIPELLGVIRIDTRVRDAIRNQVPFMNRYPDSEAAEDVINIAKKLINNGEINE